MVVDRAACLESLLDKNYDGIIDSRCIDSVLNYVRNNESVAGEDTLFIKKLTKVCSHILNSEVVLDNSDLEKLFSFNMIGFKKTKKDCSYISKFSKVIMASHFLSYAGDTAEVLFKRTRDLKWAKRFYACNKVSADIVRDFDERHAAYSYGHAGGAARILFVKTKNAMWCERWFDCDKLSGEMSINFDKRHSTYRYRYAGDAAKTLFEVTGEEEFRIEAIDYYTIFLDYYRRNFDLEMEDLVSRIKGRVSELINYKSIG